MSKAILEGITVVDMSQIGAGPIASMVLGDMGANVIKIEAPSGDACRLLGPPFAQEESGIYLSVNRNKKGIALDFKKPEGVEVIKKLIAKADIFLESNRPGVMDRLGLGYEQVREINPQIIYVSISGFGQTGPYAQRPGVDGVLQAMGGIMSVTGEEGRAPVKAGVPATDTITGYLGTMSILGALIYRDRHKQGQKVELSLLDSIIALQVMSMGMYLISGENPKRYGSHAPYAAPNGVIKTKDGYVMIAAYHDKKWKSLCEIINRQDLLTNHKFETNPARVDNRDELMQILEASFCEKTSQTWLELLTEADIICAPINTYSDLVEHPQVKANNMIIEVPHPLIGKLKMVGFAPKYSLSPMQANFPPPLFGEHTEEILQNAGYTAKQINVLLDKGVAIKRG